MTALYHELLEATSCNKAEAPALIYRGNSLSYASLRAAMESIAAGMRGHGLQKGYRVAIYLPKQEETVITFFAVSLAGGIFVPVNPVLKARQVAHILSDSGATMLVTSADRAKSLVEILPDCSDLKQLIIIDDDDAKIESTKKDLPSMQSILQWQALLECGPTEPPYINTDDSVAILYTSGSTGKPKGVVVTHRNLVTGSESVCHFLKITDNDRILALLPFSFDYGLNQLTTVIRSGACLVLMNYLMPQEVPKIMAKEEITGLAAVPSLWVQLAMLDWPESVQTTLRYITSSGGPMPQSVLTVLRQKLPRTDIFLMYGLTEAFRSSFLPPEELDRRPTSIGKAIPHATLSVLRPDGTHCDPGEPGELVHAGPLVAKGYWNDPEATAKRFGPLQQEDSKVNDKPDIAVWSGDTVTMDEDGYLYFVGREDDMIKTAGYRVSPTEIEEVVYDTGLVREAVAFGVPHPTLGQAIVVAVTPANNPDQLNEKLLGECKLILPSFMIPAQIDVMLEIPRTPHGKFDRKKLAKAAQELFTSETLFN